MSSTSDPLTSEDFVASTLAFNVMLGDLEDAPPSRLVHYTSLTGAKSILTDQGLWATDPQFLNDTAELTHVRVPFLAALSNITTEAAGRGGDHAVVAERFAIAVRYRPETPFHELPPSGRKTRLDRPLSVYVACFSGAAETDADGANAADAADDRLSQWRGYGGTTAPAYALTFDAGRFTYMMAEGDPPSNRSSMPHLVKVEYDPRKQVAILERFLRSVYEDLVAKYHRPSFGAYLDNMADWVRGTLRFPAVSFKHGGFREEQEWRLVLRGTTAPPRLRETSLGLAPYRNLVSRPMLVRKRYATAEDYAKYGDRLPLVGITQGPAREPELALTSMRLLLRQVGYTALALDPDAVRTSDTPYRT